MKTMININCPECGCQIRQLESEGFHIIRCDIEYGGCDEYFAIRVKFKPVVKVFRLESVSDE